MGFFIRISCDDCEGDKHGCFGGGFEDWTDHGALYPTREAAESAAEDRIKGAPWSYTIIEAGPKGSIT